MHIKCTTLHHMHDIASCRKKKMNEKIRGTSGMGDVPYYLKYLCEPLNRRKEKPVQLFAKDNFNA